MARLSQIGRLIATAMIAVAGLFALPAGLRAETLVIRNDTNIPVVIQTAIVVNNTVKVDRPVVIKAGGNASISLPGNKLISVYNGRNPSQILNKSTIPASKEDGIYSIQADVLPGRVKLEPVKTDTHKEKKDKPEKDPKQDKKNKSDKDR
jgi:hypothetical protein